MSKPPCGPSNPVGKLTRSPNTSGQQNSQQNHQQQAPRHSPRRNTDSEIVLVLLPTGGVRTFLTQQPLVQARLDGWVDRRGSPSGPRSGSGTRGTGQGGAAATGGRRNPAVAPRTGPAPAPEPVRASNNRLDEASLSGDRERAARAALAEETLQAIAEEKYKIADGKEISLIKANKALDAGTKYYPSNYFTKQPPPPASYEKVAQVDFQERSTVSAARAWAASETKVRVGVLNFASATRRGGGFKNGAQAQEESLARASNLYHSLSHKDVEQFYDLHQKDDGDGFYSDAMIYSKDVTLIRDEKDKWAAPLAVDIVTSAAVNAGLVRRRASGTSRRRDEVELDIETTMIHRMSKILQLLEERKARVLILGSFGTGVFQNSIATVAACWAELLGHGGAFSQSFDHVEFAILGGSTFRSFRDAYVKTLSAQLHHYEETSRRQSRDKLND